LTFKVKLANHDHFSINLNVVWVLKKLYFRIDPYLFSILINRNFPLDRKMSVFKDRNPHDFTFVTAGGERKSKGPA